MGEDRLRDASGGQLGRLVRARHGKVGLGIDGVARGGEALQHLARVGVAEHRPGVALGDAAQQGRQAAFEPDCQRARLLDGAAGARLDEGAAAGGEHDRLAARQQAGDDPALASRKCASP
jgi:hypothetical protein